MDAMTTASITAPAAPAAADRSAGAFASVLRAIKVFAGAAVDVALLGRHHDERPQ